MKTLNLLTALLLLSFIIPTAIKAQTNQSIMATLGDDMLATKNYTIEMVPPAFYGGQEELNSYIKNNLEYPKLAIRQGLEGVVHVVFKITAEGSIQDVKVKKTGKRILDEAAVDLVRKMPHWHPAKMGENPVDIYYQLPIRFNLN